MTATIAIANLLPNRNYGYEYKLDYKLYLKYDKTLGYLVELRENNGERSRTVKEWSVFDLKEGLAKFSKIVKEDRQGEPFWR